MTLEPLDPQTLFILPFLGDGFTSSGIYVCFDRRYPPILGRVLACGSGVDTVRPGDVVIYRPHAFEEAESSLGTIRFIHSGALAGRIEGYTEE